MWLDFKGCGFRGLVGDEIKKRKIKFIGIFVCCVKELGFNLEYMGFYLRLML